MATIFKSLSFYLSIFGILSAIIFQVITLQPVPPVVFARPPAISPFARSIAATGIIESFDNNLLIGAPIGGLIEKIWIQDGAYVQEGDPLFRLDTRELKAKLTVQMANIQVAKSTLAQEQDKLNRFLAVSDQRAFSQETLETTKNNVLIAQSKLKVAAAETLETKQQIERMTVRAPISGRILQANIRVGEYLSPNDSRCILGNVDTFQVRVNIDEFNIGEFDQNSHAVAFSKSNTSLMIPLKFTKIDPYVIPKKMFAGTNNERVDTRVLQVVYTLKVPKNTPLYVGQQVDVFIEKILIKAP